MTSPIVIAVPRELTFGEQRVATVPDAVPELYKIRLRGTGRA